ncbi:alkaline phosphatase family protein [Thermocladium modestius]|nr:alkaline phosphatase family protein [Thermocladium modestius]
MKLLFLVLDGAADNANDVPTPYMAANKPGLDGLARQSRMGVHYPLGRGVAPESDSAVMSILGYDPNKYYTGRGPLEALGAGYKIREGYEVAFRANFATIDASRNIVDRRVGRNLSSEEAAELARAVDNMKLGGGRGYARVIPTIGHRAVVVIGSSDRLSGYVSNNDPGYARQGKISIAVPNPGKKLPPLEALDSSEEARRTAELANEFVDKAIKILADHEVNKRREREGKLPGNVILIRDAGHEIPHVEPAEKVFGLRFGAVTEMPVERGIAIALGMDSMPVSKYVGTKEEVLGERLEATLRLLDRVDVAYVHLKGPDEPGHDGDFKRKVEEIEAIDKYYVQRLNSDSLAVLVTSDHATPWRLRSHSGDPVPFMVKTGSGGDGFSRFDEVNALKGSLGIVEHGWFLLPLVLKLLRKD